jgi:hypothetical protein
MPQGDICVLQRYHVEYKRQQAARVLEQQRQQHSLQTQLVAERKLLLAQEAQRQQLARLQAMGNSPDAALKTAPPTLNQSLPGFPASGASLTAPIDLTACEPFVPAPPSDLPPLSGEGYDYYLDEGSGQYHSVCIARRPPCRTGILRSTCVCTPDRERPFSCPLCQVIAPLNPMPAHASLLSHVCAYCCFYCFFFLLSWIVEQVLAKLESKATLSDSPQYSTGCQQPSVVKGWVRFKTCGTGAFVANRKCSEAQLAACKRYICSASSTISPSSSSSAGSRDSTSSPSSRGAGA